MREKENRWSTETAYTANLYQIATFSYDFVQFHTEWLLNKQEARVETFDSRETLH